MMWSGGRMPRKPLSSYVWKDRILRVAEIARKLHQIHYTELAVLLMISPSSARQLAVMAAKYYPDLEYRRGVLSHRGEN